jgi:pyruvate formate lyase activating enzyme
MVKGIVFNIQRFSIQDGPGIRTTVFFKGCPLRCVWCSNPESQNSTFEIAHRNSVCKKCGRCVEACPEKAISLGEKSTGIDRKICTECRKCVETCPFGVYQVYGKKVSVEEVYEEVIRDKPFYDNSGGGITASGGEPLLQANFVAELFKRCQENNINTCLDTCGYADTAAWEKTLPYTNLVLYDLKLMNSKTHSKWTGKSNDKILRGIRLVTEFGVPLIVRIPVIPGVNDSKENMMATALFVKELGQKDVNLLPYHRFGESKYTMLDRRYGLSKLRRPDDSALEILVNVFKNLDLQCKIIE